MIALIVVSIDDPLSAFLAPHRALVRSRHNSFMPPAAYFPRRSTKFSEDLALRKDELLRDCRAVDGY